MIKKIKKWKRNCPNPDSNSNCKKEISYSTKCAKVRAEKWNTKCISCAAMGRVFSEKVRKKLSESNTGQKRSEETRKKLSESHKGIPRSEETRKRIGEFRKGKKWSEEVRKKMKFSAINRIKPSEETRKKQRLSRLKYLKQLNGQISPNYNPVACGIINDYNKKHGFNFQHAENGGEVCVDGYWPDGVDQEKMTIIEIDEKHHFDSSGNLKEKDIQRQRYLEDLGYKFIRIKI